MSAAPFVIVRKEYLDLCAGDHCAAAILALLEGWTRGKQARGLDTWIYKKQKELVQDLLGMFPLRRVVAGLQLLIAKGYLKVRANPYNRQDKTWQYQFQTDVVRLALGTSEQTKQHPADASAHLETATTHSGSSKMLPSDSSIPTENDSLDTDTQPTAAPTRPIAAAAISIDNPEESFDGEQTGEHVPAKPLESRESDRLKDSELLTDAHPHPPSSAAPPAPTLEMFYGGAAAFARLEHQYGRARLEAEKRWCESEQSGRRNPVGLALYRLARGLWTPAVESPEIGQPGEHYLGGVYASFLANYQEN